MVESVIQTQQLERVATGIPGLDAVLGGGFYRGGLYGIAGLPGTGKTVLGNQICFNHVASGGRAVYVTLLGEEHARMLSYLQSLTFFDPGAIASTLYYFSAYQALLEEGLGGLLEFLRRAIRDHQATMLVLDGLIGIKAVAESELAFKNFIHDLQVYTSAAGCTTFLLSPSDSRWPRLQDTIVDGLMTLNSRVIGLRAARELEVQKFRGSSYLAGRHVFEITHEAIVVYPRTEAVLDRPAIVAAAPTAMESLALPALDEMLGGGLPVGSTTMLLGGPGSGKTLLGLTFLAAGARENQPGLHFGFYETPPVLINKADRVGLDLGSYAAQGLIEILWQPPLESSLDALAERLLAAARHHRVRRLFIDGFAGFQQIATYPERLGRFCSALTNELRALGVTTLFSAQMPHLFEPTTEMPVAALSAVVDTIIVLRSVERGARRYRLVSILKGGYDQTIRKFSITEHGIYVAATPESVEELLANPVRPGPVGRPEPLGSRQRSQPGSREQS